jgi:hypothetical protein
VVPCRTMWLCPVGARDSWGVPDDGSSDDPMNLMLKYLGLSDSQGFTYTDLRSPGPLRLFQPDRLRPRVVAIIIRSMSSSSPSSSRSSRQGRPSESDSEDLKYF